MTRTRSNKKKSNTSGNAANSTTCMASEMTALHEQNKQMLEQNRQLIEVMKKMKDDANTSREEMSSMKNSMEQDRNTSREEVSSLRSSIELVKESLHRLQYENQKLDAELACVSKERDELQTSLESKNQPNIMPIMPTCSLTLKSMLLSRKDKSVDMNVPLPRQSEYNGSTSRRGFISQFKNLATSCKCKVDKKIFRLLQSMRGGAATIAFEKVMKPVTVGLCNTPNDVVQQGEVNKIV